jgi:hypothetical protein
VATLLHPPPLARRGIRLRRASSHWCGAAADAAPRASVAAAPRAPTLATYPEWLSVHPAFRIRAEDCQGAVSARCNRRRGSCAWWLDRIVDAMHQARRRESSSAAGSASMQEEAQ